MKFESSLLSLLISSHSRSDASNSSLQVSMRCFSSQPLTLRLAYTHWYTRKKGYFLCPCHTRFSKPFWLTSKVFYSFLSFQMSYFLFLFTKRAFISNGESRCYQRQWSMQAVLLPVHLASWTKVKLFQHRGRKKHNGWYWNVNAIR